MVRVLLIATAVCCSVASVGAQSRKHYDGFYIDVSPRGKAISISFAEGDGVGCSAPINENGVITSITWDIVPTKFSVRFKSRPSAIVIPDTINNISNVDRALLADIFRKGKQVKVRSRGCGSGLVPDLLGVSVLR